MWLNLHVHPLLQKIISSHYTYLCSLHFCKQGLYTAEYATSIAVSPQNKALNRFANITACEFTPLTVTTVNTYIRIMHEHTHCITDDNNRILLNPVLGCENDYINASYVDVSCIHTCTSIVMFVCACEHE